MSVIAPLLGGAMIGLAAAVALAVDGRIAGVSGVLGRLLVGGDGRGFRVAFLAGLVAVGLLGAAATPSAFGGRVVSLPLVGLAGVLVGWGTRVSNGCTSGHGVCGVGRLSPRSIVAVVTFMVTGAATVAVVRLLGLGGAS
ncbi:MAG: YeeE/YedE family protein [Kofleriaceae bacterium]|nr:YeeE/YedE family protein [Kofleriaceae bacterium]MCB9573290.1 YeeE/YedE family protein [Kofleriaceae bacterium]